MSGYYPYLLCGLPELGFDMNLDNFSYTELTEEIFELLQPADAEKARLFSAFSGHSALVEEYLSREDEDARKEYVAENPLLPAYQKRFFLQSPSMLLKGDADAELDLLGEEVKARLKTILDKAFYAETAKSRTDFIRKWYSFDLVLRNTLVGFAARLQQRDPSEEFVHPCYTSDMDSDEAPEIIRWIKENFQQEDFGLRLRLSYVDELFNALALTDVYARERGVDRFRWNMAEEMVKGKSFSFDEVLAYLLKAGILRRWKDMDKAKGLEMLQRTVGEMRKVEFMA